MAKRTMEELLRAPTKGQKLLYTSKEYQSNRRVRIKAITTRSGVAYEGPSIPTNPSPKKVVERETKETTDKEQTNFQGSTAQIPPPVIPISILEPDVPKTLPKTIPESDILKSLPKPNIPYPSRRDDQKSRDKALNQMEKIFQIFQDLRFDISFADALLLMPRFAPTIKSLLMNKEKLLELAKIPLNENCSAMLLKKLPKKLGDPGNFPCRELTPTRMTLELADRSITHPKGLAEDVYVKVGKFHFPTDFVVVDFEADPRVPLILGRSFLRTGHALIDYALEFLGFSNKSSGGNPTPTSEPLTSEFILEEIEAYLKDDSISLEIDHADCDPERDICLIENLSNNDPFQLPPMDLKQREVIKAKSSMEEPPELELKDLPSHLEYDRELKEMVFPIPLDPQRTGWNTKLSHAQAYEAPILVVPDWNLPFELMCDASDFAIGAVLGQRKMKHFQPIHYASKTMTEAQIHYTTTEKEMLAVMYAFEKFWPYLVLSKSIVYTDHSALKYLMNKQDAKPRLLRWVLLLQEFDITIRDKKGSENLAADHLSRLESPHKDVLRVSLSTCEQYFEIHDLKAQLQDKVIAISELKKLIEKMKGKYVETKFKKSSVIRQPNASKSQRQSVLGKPTIFSDSLEKKDFSKSKSVTKNNVSNDFSKPVTAQILPQNIKSILKNTNVIAQGMYKVHTEPNQTRTPQLPQDIRKTNKRVSFSRGVIPTTSVSRPQLKSNRIGDRVLPNNSQGKKQEVEDYHRNFKFSNNKTFVTACNDSLNAKTLNVNFVCVTCGKCVLNDNHDMCVLHYINGVNSRTRQPIDVPIRTREPKQTVNQSVATSHKKTVLTYSTVKKPINIIRKIYEKVSKTCSWWYPKITPPRYKWKPKSLLGKVNPNLVEVILCIVESGCSKHMTGNLKLLTNFVEKFLGTVKFGNDQIASILGYGDLVQGTITMKRAYYVEGLNHNLFSVGQFCDADLEVAFRKSTCYIHDLKGNELLTGSRGTDLYSITLQDTTTPNPICLMAKSTSS
ncbi:retrovirus-related pol polyprotein from transposon TNT 1-94 [Tanacetum coccineum]